MKKIVKEGIKAEEKYCRKVTITERTKGVVTKVPETMTVTETEKLRDGKGNRLRT